MEIKQSVSESKIDVSSSQELKKTKKSLCIKNTLVIVYILVCLTFTIVSMVIMNRMLDKEFPNPDNCIRDRQAAQDYITHLGKSNSILFTVLAVSLIIVSVILHCILKKHFSEDQLKDQKNFIRWMIGMFTLSYLLRAVYSFFYGDYHTLIDDNFDR